MPSSGRRVVITGMGVLTPLGNTVEELFRAAVNGRSGVGPITRFNASTFPTRFAAEVKDFDLSRFVRDADQYRLCGLNTQLALAAATAAVKDSGLTPGGNVDPTRFGIYLGTGEGTQDLDRVIGAVAQGYRPEQGVIDARLMAEEVCRTHEQKEEFEKEVHTPPARLAAHFGLEGPNWNCLTACAAGTQAVGEATDLIRHGEADVLLSGGTHSMIHAFGVMGFSRLTALSTRNDEPTKASRPFDLRRDGFVLGEGAAVVVLEELEHAKRRGATIHAEITGYGSTADAYRLTDSAPDGASAARAMSLALADAALLPEAVGYINAHGTSTQVNDKVETIAIKKVFGEQAYKVPISSSKSMLGHLIAAAGAVELVLCVQSLQRGVLHPTINYETPDPECDLDYIPNEARERKIDHALSNSFGFGGQNVSLVVSRFRS
jgi:3-oxoacyl-[acyl-carrier-protein] synthase II